MTRGGCSAFNSIAVTVKAEVNDGQESPAFGL
jgi:hypothetical protein